MQPKVPPHVSWQPTRSNHFRVHDGAVPTILVSPERARDAGRLLPRAGAQSHVAPVRLLDTESERRERAICPPWRFASNWRTWAGSGSAIGPQISVPDTISA